MGITTDTTSNLSSTCVVLALVAGRQNCQPWPNSQQQALRILFSSFQVSGYTNHDCKYSLRDAFQCTAQSNTTLHDCILYHNISMIQARDQALQISAALGTCIWDPVYQGNICMPSLMHSLASQVVLGFETRAHAPNLLLCLCAMTDIFDAWASGWF